MAEPNELPRIPTETELAWAAGLIDGEGCIGIKRRKPSPSNGRVNVGHTVFLRIGMNHRKTIEYIRNIFEVGSLCSYTKKNVNANTLWIWDVTTKDAHAVLLIVRPYLITKSQEADIALEFLQGYWGGGQKLDLNVVAERERLFVLMRDAKPTAKFKELKERSGSN